MKSFFKRVLLLGLSLSIAVLVVTQSEDEAKGRGDGGEDGHAQGASEPIPASHDSDATIPFHPLTGTTVTFSGTVVRTGSRFALRETAGVLYTLDSAGRAWPFEGDSVRVTGKLDTTTRLLHVDAIEPMAA